MSDHTRSYDVIVVGGGTAGVIAGLSAAYTGSSTLIIEAAGSLGGTMTNSEVNQIMTLHDSSGEQVHRGIIELLVRRLQKEGGSPGHVDSATDSLFSKTPYDTEILRYVAQEMCLEKGIELLFHSFFKDVLMDGPKVEGVVVLNKSGEMSLKGRVVIDCTGDGDVIAKSGAPFEKAYKDEMQPMTLMFRMSNVDVKNLTEYIRDNPEQFTLGTHFNPEDLPKYPYFSQGLKNFPPWKKAIERGVLPRGIVVEQAWFGTHGTDPSRNELYVNASRLTNVDGTDAWDLSRAEVEGRRQVFAIADFLKKHMPGCRNAYIMNTASYLGVRDTRRLVGQYVLTTEDILEGHRFPDSVGRSACPIDVHKGGDESDFVWKQTSKRGSVIYEIPYRCLLPRKIEGLLGAGRIISATHEASGSTRLMGTCMATGQAAGVAAALTAEKNTVPSLLDVSELQQHLARLEEVDD